MTPRFSFSLLAVLWAVWVLPGCNIVPDPPKEIEGWKPIYGDNVSARNIYAGAPETVMNPGKIYLRNPHIFLNDIGRGIHVIDNTNPSAPVKIAFIHIPLNVDMAVKNQVLYADNGSDLVALDITQPTAVTVLERIPNLFPVNHFPPFEGWFECYEETRGVIVGWEKATLYEPECYR